MIFVAPITHFDYSQYAERTIMKPYDPYHFQSISKISPTLNSLHQESLTKDDTHPSFTKNSKPSPQQEQAAHIYSMITGIGLNFDQYV